MNFKPLILGLAVVLMGTVSFADEPEPGAIFKKVIDVYQALDAYSSEGTIIMDGQNGAIAFNTATSFSIKLKKPSLYLITWDQKNPLTPAFRQAGAVWNAGTQPYVYMEATKAYSKLGTDDAALGAATGISGGAAFTVPSLFLPVFKKMPVSFSRLTDPKLGASETVEGDDCYVISGASPIAKMETFWISKKTLLIRKYARSLEAPEGGRKIPEMTDQQLEEAIKSMGQAVTEERKKTMREMMTQAAKTMKSSNLKGTVTELHTTISTPKLDAADFAFKVPAGTPLKDSLFEMPANPK